MESSRSEIPAPQRASGTDSDFRDLLREMSRRSERNEKEMATSAKNLIKFNKSDYETSLIKNFTKKEGYFSNILKTETKKNFESSIIDDRLDSYVRDLFRENRRDVRFEEDLDRVRRQTTRLLPREMLPVAHKGTFSMHGLSAGSMPAAFMRVELKVDGERVLVDKEYTGIDFMPERARRDASKLTNSLANAIKGMTGLVAAIDAREVDLEPVFVGTTNINMALISQRLGFRVIDSCRNPDGTIDKSKTSFTVA